LAQTLFLPLVRLSAEKLTKRNMFSRASVVFLFANKAKIFSGQTAMKKYDKVFNAKTFHSEWIYLFHFLRVSVALQKHM